MKHEIAYNNQLPQYFLTLSANLMSLSSVQPCTNWGIRAQITTIAIFCMFDWLIYWHEK